MKIALIISLAITVSSAFEYRAPEGSSPFPYLTAARDYSCPGIVFNPSLLPFNHGITFSGTASRPYYETGLIAGSSAFQYSASSWGTSISWNYFGTDIYRENIYSMNAGYAPFNFISLGLTGKAYSLSVRTGEISDTSTIYDYGASVTLRPFKFMDISFIQENINTLINKTDTETIYPEKSAGILVKPDRGFSLAWNITDTSSGIINTVTASVNPLSRFNLTGGYSRETASYSASASVFTGKIKIQYSLLYHSYLGYTHSASVTLYTGSLPESVSYGKSRPSSEISPVNINRADYEDIINLPGINETYAGRIIAYRNEIGPVSPEALSRIGMSGEEQKKLDDYIYGLERDRVSLASVRETKPERSFRQKRESREDKAKRLFRQMLAQGIPARKSIEYSRLAASGENKKLNALLQSDSSLNERQKALVKRTCGLK